MANSPFFKIFLSSPGDVKEERDSAQQVVEELNRDPEFSSDFALKLYRWDDEKVVIPMEVEDTPQKSVDRYMIKPSACDLVIVIFWSKMGTRVNIDGRDYHSGTHYEYVDARENKHDGKPHIWLYRRTEKPSMSLDDDEADEKLTQYKRLKQFFADFRDEEGRIKGGVNEYDKPKAFGELFKKQLESYLRHLRKNSSQPASPPPEHQPTYTGEPYRGLRALGVDDGPIFFGRERETLDVLAQLEQTRFMVIVGASGSGKSSLAAAGAAARLKARGGWQIVRFTPEKEPFYNLAHSLYQSIPAFKVPPFELDRAAEERAALLRAHPDRFERLLEDTLPKGEHVLLLADQLEELFSLTAAEADGAATVQQFADLLRRPSKIITVLATMRADFMEAAIPYFVEELRGAYTLGKPSSVALYEMILRPAQLAGIGLDDGLAQQIAEDAGSQPGALALVAYVLRALHERNPQHLQREDYDRLGGVENAIGEQAEKVFRQLDLPEKEKLLQTVFRDLVVVNEQGVATRQAAMRSSFSAEEMALINALTPARLLVIDKGSIEVAHEAVFRSWTRLQEWIKDEQEDLILLRQFKGAAAEWVKKGFLPDLLWTYERQKPVFDMIARRKPKLDKNERLFIIPEYHRLLEELTLPQTAPKRRRTIGERLAALGDPRAGVGVRGDAKPEVEADFIHASETS